MNLKHINMRYFSYFRSGPEEILYTLVGTPDEFIRVIKYCSDKEINYKVIGATTNIIFKNEISVDLIIDVRGMNSVEFNNECVVVQAGRLLSDLCRDVLVAGLTGLEGLEGIPGTVGGAVFMNAGAYGYLISDHITEVKVLDENLNVKELLLNECKFGKRTSIFREQNLFILSIKFKLKSGDRERISEKMEHCHIARHKYQEWTYPNVGSNFVLNGSLAKALIKREDGLKRIVYNIIYKIYFSRLSKLVSGKYPNKKYLTNLLSRNFRMNENYFSKKNINTCINYDGDIDRVVENIFVINETLNGEYSIETEIVE